MDFSVPIIVLDVVVSVLWLAPVLSSIASFSMFRNYKTKDKDLGKAKNAALVSFLVCFIGAIAVGLLSAGAILLRVTGSSKEMREPGTSTGTPNAYTTPPSESLLGETVTVHSHAKMIYTISLVMHILFIVMAIVVTICSFYSLQLMRTSPPYIANPDDPTFRKIFGSLICTALISILVAVFSLICIAIIIYKWSAVAKLLPTVDALQGDDIPPNPSYKSYPSAEGLEGFTSTS